MNNQISERRIKNNRARRRRQIKRQLMLFFTTILLIACFSVLGFGIKAKAQSSTEDISYKYYKSIMVQSGDTIWDYAKAYADHEFYDSYDSYIAEVMQINSLDNDAIQSGQYIILPYYSNEFVE